MMGRKAGLPCPGRSAGMWHNAEHTGSAAHLMSSFCALMAMEEVEPYSEPTEMGPEKFCQAPSVS